MFQSTEVSSQSFSMNLVNDVTSQVWCHASLLLGVFGNSFVLYSTIYNRLVSLLLCYSHLLAPISIIIDKINLLWWRWQFFTVFCANSPPFAFPRAIKLDKLSVWIIQNLAAWDLANTILLLVPVIGSLYAHSTWPFSHPFCQVMFVYKYMGCVANGILINALALNKLLRCLFPLRIRTISHAHRAAVSTLTVCGTLLLPIWSYYGACVAQFLVVEFSPGQCMCWSVFTGNSQSWQHSVGYFLATLLNGLPCLTLCFMNTFLVAFALKKSNTTVNKLNIVIVVLVTLAFILPMLPYFIYYMIHGNDWDSSIAQVRFVTFVMFISSWANPPIYLLTNRSFKMFTLRLLRRGRVQHLSNSSAQIFRKRSVVKWHQKKWLYSLVIEKLKLSIKFEHHLLQHRTWL